MSKRDCNRKGYLKGSVRSRIVCEKQLISIEKTAKDKKETKESRLSDSSMKELQNILDEENMMYNISLGDVLACLDWLGKVFYILDECLDITDCNHVSDRQQTSGQCHTGVAQIPDKHHNRLHHTG